jgi:hypothetical protein
MGIFMEELVSSFAMVDLGESDRSRSSYYTVECYSRKSLVGVQEIISPKAWATENGVSHAYSHGSVSTIPRYLGGPAPKTSKNRDRFHPSLVLIISDIVDYRFASFTTEWGKRCLAAKRDAEGENDADRWPLCRDFYGTSLEKWWCKCPPYQRSAYHICKHLIRLYIGEDGIRSNKPRQPQYGEAWRQSKYPILWVKGIHDENLLVERDLRKDSKPPILPDTFETVAPYQVFPQAPVEETVWDPSDEDYSDDGVDNSGDDDMERGEFDGAAIDPVGQEPGSEAMPREDIGDEDFTRVGMEDDDFTRLGMEDGETMEEFMERENRGEQKLDALRMLRVEVSMLLDYMQEIERYPASHRHIEEIPLDLKGLMDCAKRDKALSNATTSKPTWGSQRRGNMFID